MRPIVAVLIAAFATPALAQVEQHQLDRPDGSTIHYSVDRPADTPTGTILIAQGSGCLPVAKSANLTKIRVAFPSHMAIMVEKAGALPPTPSPMASPIVPTASTPNTPSPNALPTMKQCSNKSTPHAP